MAKFVYVMTIKNSKNLNNDWLMCPPPGLKERAPPTILKPLFLKSQGYLSSYPQRKPLILTLHLSFPCFSSSSNLLGLLSTGWLVFLFLTLLDSPYPACFPFVSYVLQIASNFLASPFTFFMVPLDEPKILILMWSNL